MIFFFSYLLHSQLDSGGDLRVLLPNHLYMSKHFKNHILKQYTYGSTDTQTYI